MAKYNGAESSFSIQFGEKLSHLKVNPRVAELIDVNKLLKQYKKDLKENYSALVNLEKTETGRKNKVYGKRKN